MTAEDMIRSQAGFPELADIARELAEHWQSGARVIDLQDLQFEMIVGDARERLPQWPGRADAWFLDGFSPAKNPELWEESLIVEVGAHTAPNGTAATYTAAGFVRRGLAAAGFSVARLPGYGRKRHMTQARKGNA